MTRILLLIITVLLFVEASAKDCAISGQKYNITLTFKIQQRAIVWKVDGKDIRDAQVDISTGSTCLPPLFAPTSEFVFHCMNNGTSYAIETENPEIYKNRVFDTDITSLEDNIRISVIEPAIISMDPNLPENFALNGTMNVSCDISCTGPNSTISWKYRAQRTEAPLNEAMSSFEDCGIEKKNGSSTTSISSTTSPFQDLNNFTIICELSYSGCDNVFTNESSLIVIAQKESSTLTTPSSSDTLSLTQISTDEFTTTTVNQSNCTTQPAVVFICIYPYNLPTLIICVIFVVAACVTIVVHCVLDQQGVKAIIDVCLVLLCLGCAVTSFIQILYVADLIDWTHCEADRHYASIVFICFGLVCTIVTVILVLKRRVCNKKTT